MYRWNTFRKVAVSIELPEPVALAIRSHGKEFVFALTEIVAAVARCHIEAEDGPSPRLTFQDSVREIQGKLRKYGRLGYRQYRRRIRADGYFTLDGVVRERAYRRRSEWQNQILSDIADELGVEFAYAELAVRHFRKSFETRVKRRRNRIIFRLCLKGMSNKEIAARVDVHAATVAKVLRHHSGEFAAYREAHPDIIPEKTRRKAGSAKKRPALATEISPTPASASRRREGRR
jgi:hypothetical protein